MADIVVLFFRRPDLRAKLLIPLVVLVVLAVIWAPLLQVPMLLAPN